MTVMKQLTTPTGIHYTREFDLGGTRTIYNGVMVGKYRHYVAEALTQAIDSILTKSSYMQDLALKQ